MKEIWRACCGFEGGYEVSNFGRVKSFRRSDRGKLLKPGVASNGYLTVALGRGHTRTVHSLVAEAFIGPKPKNKEVLHKDGSRKNNRVDNLRYGTRGENNRQTVLDGRRKITVSQLRWAREQLALGKRGVGARVAKKLGVGQSQVSNIKHGRHYAHVA